MGLRLLRRKESGERLEIVTSGDLSSAAPLTASGDARIEGGADFPSGLVACGDLTLGPDARVRGDVRVAGDLTLEAAALLEGDVTVEGDAIVRVGARVEGHLSCRRLLLVDDVAHHTILEPAEGDEE